MGAAEVGHEGPPRSIYSRCGWGRVGHEGPREDEATTEEDDGDENDDIKSMVYSQ